MVGPGLAGASPGEFYQFERKAYFMRDPDEGLVFNRTITLRDTWAKMQKKR